MYSTCTLDKVYYSDNLEYSCLHVKVNLTCTKTQKLVLSCKNENKNKIRRTWYDEGGYILKIKIKRIHTKGARAGPHC